MNKFTLKFTSTKLEKKYEHESRSALTGVLQRILVFYSIFIGIPGIVVTYIRSEFYHTGIFSCAIFFTILYYFFHKRLSMLFETFLSTLNIIITIILGGQLIILGPNIGINDPFALFFFGAITAQFQSTFVFLSQNFLVTTICLLLTSTSYFMITWEGQVYSIKYAYLMYNFLIIYQNYLQIKMRKESFLLRENEREWAKIVKKGLSSCVLTVKYNQKNNSIELDMINDKTKNILLVRDKDDFKQFSRRTLVSLNEEENCTTHQFMVDNISSIVRRKSNMNDNHVTLENQIIKALKLSIEEYKKKNSLRCDERQIEYLHDQLSIFKNRRQTRQYSKNNYEKNNGQIIYEMFGVYSVNDEEHPKKLKIKLSTFMSQTEYQCCLVIEETKDFQQLEKVRSQSKMLQNFSIQACQNLGYKLQKILAAEKVSDIISSQIYKSYNILYNLRDYICTMCNQLQVNIKKANQFPLQQLIQSVKKTFLDSDQENPDDPVKFSFINCIPDEFLNQNYLKLNQIICNTIEYFNKVSGNQSDDKWGSSQKFPTITLQSKISNPTISLLKSTAILSTIKKFSSCNMMYKQTNNQITQESENLDDQEYKDCENGQTDNFEKNPKQIEVIFQMLKGEKASCDVLKITIRNQLLLIPQKKLKRIYECIKYKLHNRSEPYSMLQWINNYYLIGQLGPYFDFFMSSSEISGTDFHFYIYQDLNLINNSQNDVIFKNSQFDSELNESKLHSFSVRTFNDQVDDTVAEKPKQLIKQESKELKCSDVLLQPIIQIQKSLIQNNNQNTNLIQSNDNNKVPQNNVVDLFLPLFEQTNSQYSNKPTSRKKSSCNLTKSDSRKRGVSFNSQQQYS